MTDHTYEPSGDTIADITIDSDDNVSHKQPHSFGETPLSRDSTVDKQSLHLDHHYVDNTDFSIRRHHQVFEEHAVGLINAHYHTNALLHTPLADLQSRDAIIEAALEDIGMVPDMRLHGSDAVVADHAAYADHHLSDASDPAPDTSKVISAFHSTLVGGESGASRFGNPSHKRLVVPMAIESEIVNNKVVREWHMKDYGAMLRQSGRDVREVATHLLHTLPPNPQPNSTRNEPPRRAYRDIYAPSPQHIADIPHFVFTTLINGKMFHRFEEVYASHAPCYTLGGVVNGGSSVASVLLRLIRAFPNFTTRVERVLLRTHNLQADYTHSHHSPHSTGGDDGSDGDVLHTGDLSVRWQFWGTHTGYGMFGVPSYRPISGFAFTQYRCESGIIKAERTLIDELAIMMQILQPHPPASH